MAESDKDAPYIPEKVPVKLGLDDTFRFRCHKDIGCFNVCCHQIDLPLTPYDILRLKNRLGMTAIEFIQEYGLPYEMDAHGMPGIKMRPLPNSTSCQYREQQGIPKFDEMNEGWRDIIIKKRSSAALLHGQLRHGRFPGLPRQ